MQGRLCSRPHCLHAVVVSSWWRLAQQEGCRIATAIWLLRIFWRQAQSASCRVAAAISLLLVFYLAAGPVSKLQGSYRGGPSQRSQISLHIPTPKLGPSLPPRNMSTVKRTAPTGQPSSPNSLASLLLLALASALARALERPMRNMAARTPCCVVETFWESGGTSSFRWHLEAVTATPQRNSIGLDPKKLYTPQGNSLFWGFDRNSSHRLSMKLEEADLLQHNCSVWFTSNLRHPKTGVQLPRHQLRPTATAAPNNTATTARTATARTS